MSFVDLPVIRVTGLRAVAGVSHLTSTPLTPGKINSVIEEGGWTSEEAADLDPAFVDICTVSCYDKHTDSALWCTQTILRVALVRGSSCRAKTVAFWMLPRFADSPSPSPALHLRTAGLDMLGIA